jgi:hypothetical protein
VTTALIGATGRVKVSSRVLLDRPPARQLRIEDIEPLAAAFQRDPRNSHPVVAA